MQGDDEASMVEAATLTSGSPLRLPSNFDATKASGCLQELQAQSVVLAERQQHLKVAQQLLLTLQEFGLDSTGVNSFQPRATTASLVGSSSIKPLPASERHPFHYRGLPGVLEAKLKAAVHPCSTPAPVERLTPCPGKVDPSARGLVQPCEESTPMQLDPGPRGSLFAFGTQVPPVDFKLDRDRLVAGNPNLRECLMVGACSQQVHITRPSHIPSMYGGLDVIEDAYTEVISLRDQGGLGVAQGIQRSVEYARALADSALEVVQLGDPEITKHVSLLADVLSFYPLCVDLHFWAIDALTALLHTLDGAMAERLAQPVLDITCDLVATHMADRRLCGEVPNLLGQLVAALALVVTPTTAPELSPIHVDFVLDVVSESLVSPISMEHGIQLFAIVKSRYRLRDRMMVAQTALRRFRSRVHLVLRALLCLGSGFDLAASDEAIVASNQVAVADPRAQAREAVEALLEVAQTPAFSGYAEKQLVPLALHEIISAMDLYAEDRKIQGAGAVALAAAIRLPNVSHEAFIRDGAFRALSSAQQHHSTSRSVALHFCEVVACVARSGPGVVEEDVVLQVVKAGVAFPSDGEVVSAALEAIHALVSRVRNLATSAAGSQVARASMDLLQLGDACCENPYTLSLLLVTLAAVTGDDVPSPSNGALVGERWREALGRAGATVLVLRTLSRHVDDPKLCTVAAIVLRQLVFNCQASREHAGQLGGFKTLAAALRRHAHRQHAARELLAACGNCAVDGTFAAGFREGLPEAADTICSAMVASTERDPDVLAQGCRALGALLPTSQGSLGRDAFDTKQISAIIDKAFVAVLRREGNSNQVEAQGIRRQELGRLCRELLRGSLAGGPVLGRLLGEDLKPTPEVVPRRLVPISK